jgi:hypothetical protein
LHKAIEDTGSKLGCVATDIMGKSGRAMLDALVAGTKDPEVLADLARGQLRKKLPRSPRRWTGGRRLTRFPFRARGAPTARFSTRSAPSSSAPKPARRPSPDHAWSPAAPLS